jgi:succinate dehydrogenase/fumarate reductase flavoprotein subunit
MVHWLKEEANHALLSHLEEEGIDLRKNPIEFQTYTAWQQGFVNVNAKTETSVKGLYATGDDAGGGISGAAVMGWFAGENAAKYAQGKSVPTDDKSIIEETRSFIEDVRRREVGPNWKEANIALSQIMGDYAGALKSATLLEAGLTYLRRLRDKAHRTMIAGNQHELMRCLEVLNLFDLGELVFVGAVERKETRGLYVRADYPYPNPLTERQLVYKDANGKPATRWA